MKPVEEMTSEELNQEYIAWSLSVQDDVKAGKPIVVPERINQIDDESNRRLRQWDALDVRKQWLRLYGFDEDEITQNCKEFPPTDFEEETKQLTAMFAIQALNEYKKCKDDNF